MTLGLMLTLGCAAVGWLAAFQHWIKLRQLPTRSEAGYDDASASPALAYKVIIAAGLALPLFAYTASRLFDPELFRTELF